MSFIQQFFTSRDNNANAETFVGQEGRLWWDPVTNRIYSSDGVTPGGIPLAGGGGGGDPGGSNSQVQFNSNGTFGGSSLLTFNRVTGALTASSFVGDGSALSNIAGANVVGEVSNATYASSAVNAINAETVTANSQPNITSVGILSSLSVSGNVTGDYFIGNGSLLTGIAGSSSNRIYNGTSNVEIATADGNATITTAGANTWTFDTAGTLNLPGGNIVQSVDNDLNIVVQDADNDDFALQTIVDDGAGTTLSRIRQRRNNIQLGVGLGSSPYYWEFVNGGTLRLPGDVWGNAGGNLTVQIPISDANSFISLQTRDNTDTLKSNINVTTTNVTISTNTAGNTWTFDTVGNLTLPNQASIGIDTEFNYTALNSAPNGMIQLQGITANGIYVGAVQVYGDDIDGGYVSIYTANVPGEFDNQWSFNPNGTISFPYRRLTGDASGSGRTFKVTSTANISILSNLDPTTADSGDDGYFVELAAGPGANSTVSGTPSGHGGNVYIAAGMGGDTNDYANAGPGGTVYITAGQTWNFTQPGGNIELQGGQGIYSGVYGNIRLLSGTGNAEFSSQTGVFSVAGNIMTGNYFIGDGGLLSNISGGGIQTSIADGNSSVAVDGIDGNVLITTNGGGGGVWTFDTAGVLTLPGEGVVRSNNDTVVIQSYDTANAVGYGIYVGTQGGLYFQQASDPVWLSIAPNASNVEISAGVATGGAAGHSISISAGAADQTNYFTTAGGNVDITGGLGAFNDGGGGGPGGSVNISSGLSSDPAGVPGNVTINSGPDTWNFDYNGTLNLPEGTAYIGSAANTLTLHANDSEAIYISDISGGISAETNGNVTLISNVDGVTNYAWTFDNTGNLAAPGIITANTFVSNAYNVLTAGNLSITSQYGLGTTGTILEDNGDLEVYGSGGGGAIVGWTNNYNTVGNVATVNFNTVDSPGNILVRTGNRAATEYNWIFANNGTMSFPGNAINTGANPVTVWSNDSSKLLWRDSAGGAPGQPVQTTITAGNGSATITVSTGVLAVQSLKTWTFNTAGNVVFPDATVQTTAYPGTANTLSLIGNITGGNIIGTHVGNLTGTTASLSGNVNSGNLLTGGLISATGNATAGNISTTGLITATGNITVGNVNTGGRVSATGNILGGNLTVAGNAVVTYTPATTVGYGITVNAANTQGGTGYADFLRATNTSTGATNTNKSFRLSSTGALEIINSAYSATLLSLSDTGALSVPVAYQVSGKQAVNGPAFSAYAAAILQNIPNGVQTKVLFQTEEFDTNNNYANSRFTPTVEGYYQLNAEVRLDGASGTGEMMIILYKNGSEYKRGTNQSGTQIASNFWAMQVSSVAYANGSTDYFEIYVQQGSGGTISVTAVNAPAITWFNGCMLRGA